MAEPAARPRWRDALVLTVLAVMIVGGLVHYGRSLGQGDSPTSSAVRQPSHGTSPTAEATAQLESGPGSDSSSPPPPSGGTCWDGRETTSLKLCGLPDGARGLAWVFPSFDKARALCHKARPNPDSYPVVSSYVCFQRVLGQAVTVTYDQVEDPARVQRWLLLRIGPQHVRTIPGPNGGRCIVKDGRNRPVRIAGLYLRFPYVVSVYAATPQAAARAWQVLVDQRPEQEIRGIRAS
jgi:hypothetical protein